MQGSMACQQCGLRLLCWVLTIYAKLLAMTFISWGRSMMSGACGEILIHNGDSCRVSSRRRDLAGTHLLSSRSDSLQTSPTGRVMTRKRRCVLMETPLVFPGEQEIFRAMYAQVGEEEQVISLPYTRTPLDASMRGRKKRKQGEDNALNGSPPCCMCRIVRHWWSSTTAGFLSPGGGRYLVTLSNGLWQKAWWSDCL